MLERGFASQAAEGTSGLVYMGARHYDPATGRFLQADPLGIEASELYAYAGNNPYAYWDPTGLAPFSVSAGGWGATGNFGLGNPLVTSASYQGTIEAASPPSLGGLPAYFDRFGVSGVSRLFEDRAIGYRGVQEQAASSWDLETYHEAAAASRRNAFTAYLTDPVNVALTAATLGEGLAARAGVGLAARGATSIRTPFGTAVQEFTPEALVLRGEVAAGRQVFRGGNFGRSTAAEGQFFAPESPLSLGFANRFGAATLGRGTPDFVIGGTIRSGAPFVTRTAPAFGKNTGGALEMVTQPGGVRLDFFHMP